MTELEIKQAAVQYMSLPKAERKHKIGEIAAKFRTSKVELVEMLYKNGTLTRKQVTAYARYNPEYAEILATPNPRTGDPLDPDYHNSVEPFFQPEPENGPEAAEEPKEEDAEGIIGGMPESVERFACAELTRLANEAEKIREEIRIELKRNERLMRLSTLRNEIAAERRELEAFAKRCSGEAKEACADAEK